MSKAQTTRKYILEKAFNLIYVNGYQATSIDRILETTKVTKGAFYYHFKNKEEMGIAMIKAIIFPRIKNGLVLPLSEYEDPINGIYKTISGFILGVSDKQMFNGCPINNIIQEMTPINKVFRDVLIKIMAYWQNALAKTLEIAVEKQQISNKHDLEGVAKFIISGYEGTRGTGKLYRSFSYYENYLKQLNHYLKSL